jgi:DNA-binding MarR family transcriptional regulator
MQSAILSETGFPGPSSGPSLTDKEFKVLLALAPRSGLDRSELAGKAGPSSERSEKALDHLHQMHLIDIVSSLDGDFVRESIRISEHGRDVLVAALESMCELPE